MSRRKKISQREAARLRRRVDELEQREKTRSNFYSREYPDGVDLGGPMKTHESWWQCVKTAQRLGYYVIAKAINDNHVVFYAVKP